MPTLTNRRPAATSGCKCTQVCLSKKSFRVTLQIPPCTITHEGCKAALTCQGECVCTGVNMHYTCAHTHTRISVGRTDCSRVGDAAYRDETSVSPARISQQSSTQRTWQITLQMSRQHSGSKSNAPNLEDYV